MITGELLVRVLKNIGIKMNENKQLLTELDAAIGDADHGINMNKGFAAVSKKLEEVKSDDCGEILKTTAMTLISTVGGASGPLYGTAFLKASIVAKGKIELDKKTIIKMFEEAIKGIVMRGKAQIGEKTMLDALIPAYEALKESIEQGDELSIAFNKATYAACEGVEKTKNIIATKGRASYLGERSIGHQDPGATSSYLMIKAIADTLI
ncbi:dihydroxyacetone kinase subunit DhaL [Crassaminicella profunda]|uniref:dihydroxyacetone kinase subunit DhaL n=1 Tax=Crassaminicella profunda TaxID=1286698 RepID=UPI001CA7A2F3|nr:dihydroxyacetone kinase subunit DhaL [Crassaminicella profunda]QZY54418.1 dihydroxyacetone kinase subunit L [Crassaminicella profunda]